MSKIKNIVVIERASYHRTVQQAIHVGCIWSKCYDWILNKMFSPLVFFGGKIATTSKMSGSIISVSSSELAVSMFSKLEMSTSLWLRRLNAPAFGIGKHSRVLLPLTQRFCVNSTEFITRVHLKCSINRCMTSAMRWRHFSYSETSRNNDKRHGKFTFLKSSQPIEKTWRPSAYCAGVPLSDGGKSQPANALIGQLLRMEFGIRIYTSASLNGF